MIQCAPTAKANESMAAQFIHPTTTPEEMVDQILRAPQ